MRKNPTEFQYPLGGIISSVNGFVDAFNQALYDKNRNINSINLYIDKPGKDGFFAEIRIGDNGLYLDWDHEWLARIVDHLYGDKFAEATMRGFERDFKAFLKLLKNVELVDGVYNLDFSKVLGNSSVLIDAVKGSKTFPMFLAIVDEGKTLMKIDLDTAAFDIHHAYSVLNDIELLIKNFWKGRVPDITNKIIDAMRKIEKVIQRYNDRNQGKIFAESLAESQKEVVWVKVLRFGRGRGGKPIFLADDGGETKDITKAKIIDPYYDSVIGARRAFAKKVRGKLVPYELIDEPRNPWKKISKVGEIPDETTDYDNRIVDIYDSVENNSRSRNVVEESFNVVNKIYKIGLKDFVEKPYSRIVENFRQWIIKHKAIPSGISIYSEDKEILSDVYIGFDANKRQYDVEIRPHLIVREITALYAKAIGHDHDVVFKVFRKDVERKLHIFNFVVSSLDKNGGRLSENVKNADENRIVESGVGADFVNEGKSDVVWFSFDEIVSKTPKDFAKKYREKSYGGFSDIVLDLSVGFTDYKKNFVFSVGNNGILERNRGEMTKLIDYFLNFLKDQYLGLWEYYLKIRPDVFKNRTRNEEYELTLGKLQKIPAKDMVDEVSHNFYRYLVVVFPVSLKRETIDLSAIFAGDKKELSKVSKVFGEFWKEAEKVLRSKYTSKLEKIFDAIQEEIERLYRSSVREGRVSDRNGFAKETIKIVEAVSDKNLEIIYTDNNVLVNKPTRLIKGIKNVMEDAKREGKRLVRIVFNNTHGTRYAFVVNIDENGNVSYDERSLTKFVYYAVVNLGSFMFYDDWKNAQRNKLFKIFQNAEFGDDLYNITWEEFKKGARYNFIEISKKNPIPRIIAFLTPKHSYIVVRLDKIVNGNKQEKKDAMEAYNYAINKMWEDGKEFMYNEIIKEMRNFLDEIKLLAKNV